MLSGPVRSQDEALPDVFFGTWVIDSVIGDDPSGFETDSKPQLLGRRVEIMPDRLTLWTLWSGRPNTVSSRTARLDELAVVQMLNAEEQRIGRMSFRFWAINMVDCRYHGEPVAACLPVILAQEEGTGKIGLYTNTLGMAFLRKVGSPDDVNNRR